MSPKAYARWMRIANEMPPEMLTDENRRLLATYCESIVRSHQLGWLINAYEAAFKYQDIEIFDALFAVRARNSRRMGNAAVKLGLIPGRRRR
jgi:hypothetical protein